MWVSIVIVMVSLLATLWFSTGDRLLRVTAVPLTLDAISVFQQKGVTSGIISVLDNIEVWQCCPLELQELADSFPSPLWSSEVLPCVDGEARKLLIASILLNDHEK